MLVVKNFTMINLDHVLHIECLKHDDANVKEFPISFTLNMNATSYFVFDDEQEQQRAFLMIIQAKIQKLDVCFIDTTVPFPNCPIPNKTG